MTNTRKDMLEEINSNLRKSEKRLSNFKEDLEYDPTYAVLWTDLAQIVAEINANKELAGLLGRDIKDIVLRELCINRLAIKSSSVNSGSISECILKSKELDVFGSFCSDYILPL